MWKYSGTSYDKLCIQWKPFYKVIYLFSLYTVNLFLPTYVISTRSYVVNKYTCSS